MGGHGRHVVIRSGCIPEPDEGKAYEVYGYVDDSPPLIGRTRWGRGLMSPRMIQPHFLGSSSAFAPCDGDTRPPSSLCMLTLTITICTFLIFRFRMTLPPSRTLIVYVYYPHLSEFPTRPRYSAWSLSDFPWQVRRVCKFISGASHHELYYFEPQTTVGVLTVPLSSLDIQGLESSKGHGKSLILVFVFGYHL